MIKKIQKDMQNKTLFSTAKWRCMLSMRPYNGDLSYSQTSRDVCSTRLLYSASWWCYCGVSCNSHPLSFHMHSIGERSAEATSQGSMPIPFTLLRVRRSTYGRALSCWNNVPAAACTSCRTTAETTWVTYRSALKQTAMCTRAVLPLCPM